MSPRGQRPSQEEMTRVFETNRTLFTISKPSQKTYDLAYQRIWRSTQVIQWISLSIVHRRLPELSPTPGADRILLESDLLSDRIFFSNIIHSRIGSTYQIKSSFQIRSPLKSDLSWIRPPLRSDLFFNRIFISNKIHFQIGSLLDSTPSQIGSLFWSDIYLG